MPDLIQLEILKAEGELARLKELSAIRRECGIALYKPHPKQDLFHRAGEFRMRYVRTGNRFGKSLCGAAEDISFALGYRPFYPEGDPARTAGIQRHSNKILIIVADWDQAELIFTGVDEGDSRGKLFKLCPTDALVGYQRNQAGKIFKVIIKSIYGGHSVIYIDTVKSFKSNPLGQESADWDLIHIDEPCPKEMFNAVARGLVDRGGSAIFTCTPLFEMWINDEFLPPNKMRDNHDKPVTDFKPSHWMLTGSMHDNPTLTKAAKDMFISTLTAEERETRIDGRPRQLTGVIYKEYDPLTHLYYETPHGWADFDEPPSDYTIRLAIDTHPKTPHAVLFSATAPTGRVYFWSEIFEKLLITDLCEQIKLRLGGRLAMRVLLEPGAWIDDPLTGTSIAYEIMQCGLLVEKASKDLSYGILQVKKFLMSKCDKGHPIAQFSSALARVPYEFDRYVWKPLAEKPLDKDDHMMECLYRLVLSGLDYVKPSTIRMPIPKDLRVRQDFSIPGGLKHNFDMPLLGPKPQRMSPKTRYRAGSGLPSLNFDDRYTR